ELLEGVTEIDGKAVAEVAETHLKLARDYYDRTLKVAPGRSDVKKYLEFLDDRVPHWEEKLQKDITSEIQAAFTQEVDSSVFIGWTYYEQITEVAADGTTSDYLHVALRIMNEDARVIGRGLDVRQLARGSDFKVVDAKLWRANGEVERGKIANTAVTTPEPDVGDVIEIRFRAYNNYVGIFGDFYGDRQAFEGLARFPTGTLKRTWVLPASREFYFVERGAVPERQESIIEGHRVVSYSATDLAKVEDEMLATPVEQRAPVVEISTFKDWHSFGKWYWDLIDRQVKSTPAIEAEVAKLTEGLSTEQEKARAIYNFTVQKIRYNAEWEFGVHGYKPYEAGAIFDRCIGDCKDKAILIVTMLREAGVKAYPVIIHLEPMRGNEKVGPAAPFHFNHAIAYVEFSDGSGQFLDGTARYSAYDEFPSYDAGAEVVVVKPEGGVRMQVPQFDPKASVNRWE
ncbi:MAG: transglutaminase domain-containing protein, partial [Planctomycetes bacterium]|nr:transglutaminase domain-containing protein [Planctomycetota bacterium]